jgi:hypothetical protein
LPRLPELALAAHCEPRRSREAAQRDLFGIEKRFWLCFSLLRASVFKRIVLLFWLLARVYALAHLFGRWQFSGRFAPALATKARSANKTCLSDRAA